MALFQADELSDEPRRLLARRLVVQSLRVVTGDYARIRAGEKREYRTYKLRIHQLREGECAIVYASAGPRKPLRTSLVVVEASYVEPLGAISPESVSLEGFTTFREFRTYFRERERVKGFRQLDRVQVVRFRPFHEHEKSALSEALFDDLYGRWA